MKGTMASPRRKTVPDMRLFCPSEWDIPEESIATPTPPTTADSSSYEWEVQSEANFRRISESSSEWLERDGLAEARVLTV